MLGLGQSYAPLQKAARGLLDAIGLYSGGNKHLFLGDTVHGTFDALAFLEPKTTATVTGTITAGTVGEWIGWTVPDDEQWFLHGLYASTPSGTLGTGNVRVNPFFDERSATLAPIALNQELAPTNAGEILVAAFTASPYFLAKPGDAVGFMATENTSSNNQTLHAAAQYTKMRV